MTRSERLRKIAILSRRAPEVVTSILNMHSFFHGWRRKAGVVTLGLALVLMAGWIRSTHFQDCVVPPRWTNLDVCFISEEQAIACQTLGRARFYPLGAPLWQANYLVPHRPSEIAWQWELGGFRYLCNSDIRCVVAPYWSLAIPLTLLSAYLILWKPRKQQPTASKPHA